MKKYYILLMVSLVNVFDRLEASYFKGLIKPVVASLAIMSHKNLTSCADDKSKGDTNNAVVTPDKIIPQSDYSKNVNSDLYKQVADELKKHAINFSDDFMQKKLRDDSDSIDGLSYQQLTTITQRFVYLQREFKGCQFSDDINFRIIHQLNDLPAEDHDDFFIKVREFAQEEKSFILNMHHFDKSYVFIKIRNLSRVMLASLYPSIDLKTLDEKIKKNELLLIASLDYNVKLLTAYHEAAHALMLVLHPFDQILSQLTLSPQGMVEGLFVSMPQNLLVEEKTPGF